MTAAIPEMEVDLRRRRAGGERPAFVDVDTFEGRPSDPMHLHKYAYGAGNPVMNVDPSGYDFSITGLLTTAGISGIISATLTGAYGVAKGWSAGQIAKAATYSFFAGAFAGAAIYGLAWGLAASAAVTAGFVASEAGAYSTLGWTAAGLITSPTTLGLAIANFVTTRKDPRADQTDRAFAGFNLAIAAFVFAGVHAQSFAVSRGVPVPTGAGTELTNKINEIKNLPENQQLTSDQLEALRVNVNLLKGVVSRNGNTPEIAGRIQSIIQNDPRFTNLSEAQRAAFIAEVQSMVK